MNIVFFDLNWQHVITGLKSERTFICITPCNPNLLGAARGKQPVPPFNNSVGVQPTTGLMRGWRLTRPELRLSACKGLFTFIS